MAIDRMTGKRVNTQIKTLRDKKIEEEKKKAEKALPKFDTTYEEELIKALFEEELKKKEEQKEVLELAESIPDKTKVHHERPGEEWDVPITEEIKYFDPELSYELTHYKPITMEKGLDFNPDDFREMAIIYEKKEKYTEFPEGSKPWRDLWMREIERMRSGYEVNGYRITGDNYYFLNFYRMQTINEGAVSGTGRTENFPSFLAKQYEWFHYVEMAEKLGKDAIALKARGLGWSEMTAAMAVRPYTTNPNYNVLLTCEADDKLQPLRDKCWLQLDWLNMNTSGGLRHVRQKVNNNDTKRASKVTRDGQEFGWGSEVNTIVADNSNKIRGHRVDRLVYEEAGSSKSLVKSWIQGAALVELGGTHFGTRIGLGCVCAGTKVWDKNGHLINIEDITKESGILGYKDGKSNVEPITYIQEECYKPCVRIILSDGNFLECSEDHPILTRVEHTPRRKDAYELRNHYYTWEWVEAKDLIRHASRNIIATISTPLVFGNEELFDPYLVGLLIGDGSYGFDKTPRLSNCDTDVWDYVDSKYKTVIERSRITKDGKDYFEKRLLGICPKLREIGIYGQTKTAKRLPDNYQDLSQNSAALMLAGLFDTDGTIDKRNGRMSLTQSSREILEQVQVLLWKFGIYTTITKREPRLGIGRKDKNPWYVLYVNDYASVEKFKKYIPIKISYKIENLNNGIATYKTKSYYQKHICKLPEGIREVSVRSVIPIGVQRIYNLTADDSHTYIANNIITHNTGGDDIAVGGLSTLFTNPEGFNILPYKNYDTYDGKPELTAFFAPAHKFALSKKYLDNRGVTNWPELKKYYEAQRSKLSGKAFLDECAEHCFVPEEALAKTGANVFDSELVSQQMVNLKIRGLGEKVIPMQLEWDKNAPAYSKVNAYESRDSKLLVVEQPLRDPDGNVYKNLYISGLDSIDVGTDNSATDDDTSDFCIVVKRRVFGDKEPKYVAVYKDRPRDIRVAYMIALKLLTWYNCQCMLEFTKISFQQFLVERKKEHLLMSRPEYAVSQKNRKKITKRLIGIPSTEAVIKHGLELISAFLSDYYYTIDYPEMLDELLKYTYENKRKFDMIAAMQCCEIGDEALTGIIPIKQQNTSKEWKDFGWFTDSNGYRHFGVIPTKKW